MKKTRVQRTRLEHVCLGKHPVRSGFSRTEAQELSHCISVEGVEERHIRLSVFLMGQMPQYPCVFATLSTSEMAALPRYIRRKTETCVDHDVKYFYARRTNTANTVEYCCRRSGHTKKCGWTIWTRECGLLRAP